MKQSRTAQGAAAQRAVLSDLGLLADPYARGMLSRPMAAMSWAVGHLPRRLLGRSVTLAGAAGSDLWFDAALTAALDEGVEQVAVIGAGFDSRAWRLRREGVRFFELDHRASQRERCGWRRVQGRSMSRRTCGRTPPLGALLAHGLDASQPAFFVVESVTMYLQEEVVQRLLGQLALAASLGNRLAVNFLPSSAPETTQTQRQLRLQRLARIGSGETFRFGTDPDEAVALVEAAGWTGASERAFAMRHVPSCPATRDFRWTQSTSARRWCSALGSDRAPVLAYVCPFVHEAGAASGDYSPWCPTRQSSRRPPLASPP